MPICTNARKINSHCQVGAIEQPISKFVNLRIDNAATNELTGTCLACREYQAISRKKHKEDKEIKQRFYTITDFESLQQYKHFLRRITGLRI